MLSVGINPPDLIADGKIHRFSSDGNPKKPSEWYRCDRWDYNGKEYFSCTFGSWRFQEVTHHFRSWEGSSLDSAEKKYLKDRQKKVDEETKKHWEEERLEASKRAKALWDAASTQPTGRQDAYLKRKGVLPFGSVRFGKNEQKHDALILPIYNIQGKLRSIQFISSNGTDTFKAFLAGGEKKGCFSFIGDVKKSKKLFVSEGFSTGASIHEATGMAVIIALDCGNLKEVVKGLKTKFTDKEIIIAGDDDHGTEDNKGNPGKEAAQKAAELYDCKALFPRFPEGALLPNGKIPTDYNDLHALCGLEEVAKQLTFAEPKGERRFSPLSLQELLNLPAKEWLVEEVIGPKDLFVLFGQPGSGKSFIAIDLIFSCCLGRPFAGRFEVERPMRVAYCGGEGLSGLPARFSAAAKEHDVQSLPNFEFIRTVPQLFDGEIDESIAVFIAEWKERHPKQTLDLLVIDTFHSATVGLEENSAKDAGRVIQSCRQASKELGCSVCLVHHTSKDGAYERGSSAIRGASDVMIRVDGLRGKGTMRLEKLKDGEFWDSQAFSLVPIEESAVVAWGASRQLDGDKPIDYISTLLEDNPKVKFSVSDLVVQIGISKDLVNRYLKELLKKGLCGRELRDPKKEKSSRNEWLFFWISDAGSGSTSEIRYTP
jgi:putative DNA primase/helicase